MSRLGVVRIPLVYPDSVPTVLRKLPGGRTLVIDVDPGVIAGDIGQWPEQRIARVRLDQDAGLGRRTESRPRRFSELDAITASEVLADLTELTTA
ncbi:hypothetical protein [Actinomadura mexicana]|uniref:hypothetical protein n=1 Tax=Actinomadura mexicana TaxID=134959 RepID=UPI001178157F|nr:hypothetical protein [Actinomadura mexicana]